jgi:hypothetical protein
MQDLKVQLINAIQDDDVKTVKAILALGIDLTQTEDYAPLAVACMYSSKKIIFSLLYCGADLFAFTTRENREHISPLLWLIISERKDIFKILFEVGYLDPHIHLLDIQMALKHTDKSVARVMKKYFVNKGVQCSSFIPSYAYDDIDYEKEYDYDTSVFQLYIGEKKQKTRVSRPPRSPRSPRVFGSSTMIK